MTTEHLWSWITRFVRIVLATDTKPAPSSVMIEAEIQRAVDEIRAAKKVGLDRIMAEKQAAVDQINTLTRQIAELDAQIAAGEQRAERIQRIAAAVTEAIKDGERR